MKSHIQIPKNLLKRFSHKILSTQNGHTNKVDAVYALSINEGTIIEEKINTFGTIENYFSVETEREILNKKIENPFCDAASIIRMQLDVKGCKRVNIKKKNKDAIYKFCQYSHLRAPRQINSFNDDALMRAFKIRLTPSEFIDMAENSPFITNPFADRLIAIIKNDTNINFVMPFHCIYLIHVDGYKSDAQRDIIILPFTPKYAIALLPINDDQKLQLDVINLTTVEEVTAMNDWAFRTELTNKQFLIAVERKELEKYVEILKAMTVNEQNNTHLNTNDEEA